MRPISFLFVFSLVSAVCVVALQCPPQGEVELYQVYEIQVMEVPESLRNTPNMFNSSHISVHAVVEMDSSSSSPHTIVPGFAYQNFTAVTGKDYEQQTPVGVPVMLIRYTPTRLGKHTMQIYAKQQHQQQQQEEHHAGSCEFIAVKPSSHSHSDGFIRIGDNKKHFAATLNEKTYFAIGENLAWTDAKGVESFEEYFKNISAHGGNYVRVWLTDGWDDLYLEDSLGNYSLPNAWHIDRVLQLAQTYGIRVLMCTESFNLFCDAPDPMPCAWGSSVYNVANGGPLTKGGEFFTNARAKQLYQQRLEYLIARYGASSAVLAWELFNEVDLTESYNATIQREWLEEMTAFVRSRDIYAHLVTTSFSGGDTTIYNLEGLSFSMIHTYGSHNANDMADNVRYWSGRLASEYVKPGFVAETGETNPISDEDPSGIGLHNSLWAAIMSGGAGTAMTWWWDSWVAKDNLYRHFSAVAEFVAREHNWHQFHWRPMREEAPTCNNISPNNYTCEQQIDHCDLSWMQNYCCQSCTKCSKACLGGNTPAWQIVEKDVRMLALLGQRVTEIGEGKVGGSSMAALWIQNSNNTYAAQNASLPAASRPPVKPVKGLEIQLDHTFEHGCYVVEWMNTYFGGDDESEEQELVVKTETVKCHSNSKWCGLTLQVPTFQGDVAGLVKRSRCD